MIKCTATDMDGTLLNSTSKKITTENRQAILAAQSQGVEVVIATGRAYDEVFYLLEESGLKCPVIGVNGAETRTKEGKVIATNPLNKHEAKMAGLELLENDVYFEVYTEKGKFTHDREKSMKVILDIVTSANPTANYEEAVKFARERAAKIHLIDDYDKLMNDDGNDIYKFLAFSFDTDRLALVNDALHKMENIVVTSSGTANLEINDKSAQKGIALERFVGHRGISLSETMAIGDNFNDISMFKRAGRSVAMGNADQLIKAQCDFVTATNEESGVAKAIWEAIKTK